MNNYEGYIKGMEKSMQEKLFFLEYLDLTDYDLIIDFGCASGNLIERIKMITKTTTPIIGIERDVYMQNILTQKGIEWKASLSDLKTLKNKNVLIIFSSVLHEVEGEFGNIAEWLLKVKPTVVIRDMTPPTDRPLTKAELKISTFNKPKYEYIWGQIKTTWNLYHYLLKYTYVDNWESEILENYFSVPWEWFFTNGITEYRRDYILEYKKTQVYKDFNYQIKEPTHRQLITKIK